MAEKRLIDANGIVAVAEHAYDAWNLDMAAADGKREINLVYKRQELCKAVKAVAENCPTVDAVEVVRCRDCIKGHPELAMIKSGVWCVKYGKDFPECGFCSYGERRTDG